ncbi:major facilitator superfamily domain-containing protein [Rhizophagus diaphanus]|nr:major facilitator superfamily domain-containing protein [Rhizophagus diaphanus] [Rhizophagus sp. MUCL 43196]
MEAYNFQKVESNNSREIFIENKELEKKLLRKIDLRVMPLLTLLYLLSFLDRVNIGNAKLAHIEYDIGFVGVQFNWCLSIFFFGYILFEIPSNLILLRTNPSLWIPFIMTLWGLVMILMAFVKNFAELMSARFFLGASILFMGTSFAGSCSGLLAYSIVRLDGKLGLKGWQWIFIIEGLMTVIVSIISYFLLSNYPEKTKWLRDEERKYVVERLKYDAGKAHVAHFNKKQIYAALTDWKVYLAMLHLSASSIVFYSFSLFIPTIVNGMGFDFVKSQLLSVPPFFCAGVSTLVVAILSDRKRIRSPFIFACSFIAIIGYILLIVPSIGIPGKYVGACIVGIGLSPINITSITWLTNNIAGHAKRGIATAMRKKENPQSFLEGKTEEEIENLGDLHPDFIYSL